MGRECPVCTERIGREEKLTCGHRVHEKCILASQKPNECCICRQKVVLSISRLKLTPKLLKRLIIKYVSEKIFNALPEKPIDYTPPEDMNYYHVVKSIYVVLHKCGCKPEISLLNNSFVGLNMIKYMLEGEQNLGKQLETALLHFVILVKLEKMNMPTIYEPCEGCEHSRNLMISSFVANLY